MSGPRARSALHNHTVPVSHGCAACVRDLHWTETFTAHEIAESTRLAYAAADRDFGRKTP